MLLLGEMEMKGVARIASGGGGMLELALVLGRDEVDAVSTPSLEVEGSGGGGCSRLAASPPFLLPEKCAATAPVGPFATAVSGCACACACALLRLNSDCLRSSSVSSVAVVLDVHTCGRRKTGGDVGAGKRVGAGGCCCEGEGGTGPPVLEGALRRRFGERRMPAVIDAGPAPAVPGAGA